MSSGVEITGNEGLGALSRDSRKLDFCFESGCLIRIIAGLKRPYFWGIFCLVLKVISDLGKLVHVGTVVFLLWS